MIRELAKSIREYKRLSIVTPILVSLEVAMECIIPFVIAILINKIKNGCDIGEVILCGAALGACSVLSLFFGAAAGAACATASCGLARNLRKDMFYSIQRYSFENIDKFMASSLVTRMTTDVTNVQNAYMMLIRMAIRSPLMLIWAGGWRGYSFLLFPFLPLDWCLSSAKQCRSSKKSLKNMTS